MILCENSIDFAMKSKNPLDNVHFFDNFDSRDKYSMLKNTVSPMYPDIFQASTCTKGCSKLVRGTKGQCPLSLRDNTRRSKKSLYD